MHGEAPPPARSNELNSGPSSSQVARRRVGAVLGRAAEKSGARNGLASWRETIACGTTRRSGAAGGSGSAGATSTGSTSRPASVCRLRMSALAASDSTASSPSNASNEVSRVAVWARTSAISSRRLSMPERRVSLLISVCTRVRSWRASRATTWNFVRTDGAIDRRSTAASTSRTARASCGIRPRLSWLRARPLLRAAELRPFCGR
jgi:hypothetical protein